MMKKLLITLFIFLLGSYGFCYSQNNNVIQTFKQGVVQAKPSSEQNTTKKKQQGGFQLLLGLAKAYNVLNEFEIAISFLQKAEKQAKENWQFSAVYVELIESYFAIGNFEKAKEYYNKALNVDGTEATLKKQQELSILLGLDPMFQNWTTFETKNIRFHFQDISVLKNVKEYTAEREKAFVKIRKFFSSELPKKINFFIWTSNEEAFQKLGRRLDFSNPRYCISHARTGTTKGKEIAHSISFWSDSSMNITHLIYEGIGVFFDQIDIDKILLAKSAIQGQSIDIKKVWVNPEDYPNEILRPVAGAFVAKLISLDKKKFLELCRNQSYQNARYIYGDELNKIIFEFNKDLNN